MNPKNYLFKTHEFAKLCNVNKKTLIYYDEIGLFKPYYTDEKGYRYYSYHQYDTFSVIAALKEIHMPLKEIKTFIDNRTPDVLIHTLSTRQNILKEHIQKLQYAHDLIDTVIQITKDSQTIDPSSLMIEPQEEEYLTLSEPILHYDHKNFLEILSHHVQYCSEHHLHEGHPIGGILSQEHLLQKDFSSINYIFTKTSTPHPSPYQFIKPKGLYAVGFHIGNYNTTHQIYSRLLDFIQQQNLVICGNSYEETLLDYLCYSDPNQYLTKVSIQVCTQNKN